MIARNASPANARKKPPMRGDQTSLMQETSGKAANRVASRDIPDFIAGYIHQCSIIGVDVLDDVLSALDEARSTHVLDLSKTHRRIDDSQIMCLASSVAHSQWISCLELANQTISVAGAMELGTVLHQNQSITKINVGGNDIRSEGLLALVSHFETQSTLIELGIASNNIGNHGAAGLARFMSLPACNLQVLDLRHNNIKHEGIERLSIALKSNEILHTLNLRFNFIRDQGCAALGSCLMKNQSLTSLDIGANEISDEGARSLAAGLFVNKSLKKLNLRSNEIQDDGFSALLECLKRNNTLTALYLGNNKPSNIVCSSLSLVLTLNNQVSQLDLQGLGVEPQSIQTTAESLSANAGIKELVIDLAPEFRDKFMGVLQRRWPDSYFVDIPPASGNEAGRACTVRIHRDVVPQYADQTWGSMTHNTTIEQYIPQPQQILPRHTSLKSFTAEHSNPSTRHPLNYSSVGANSSVLGTKSAPYPNTSSSPSNRPLQTYGSANPKSNAQKETQITNSIIEDKPERGPSFLPAKQPAVSNQALVSPASNISESVIKSETRQQQQYADQHLSTKSQASIKTGHNQSNFEQDTDISSLLQLRDQLTLQYATFSHHIAEQINQLQADQQTFTELYQTQLRALDEGHQDDIQKTMEKMQEISQTHEQLIEIHKSSMQEIREEQQLLFQGIQTQFNQLLTNTEKELQILRQHHRQRKATDASTSEQLDTLLPQRLADMTDHIASRVAQILRPDFERNLSLLSQQQSQAMADLEMRLDKVHRRVVSLEGNRRPSPSRANPSGSATSPKSALSQTAASEVWNTKMEARVAAIQRRLELLETTVKEEQAASMSALEALLRDGNLSHR